MAFLLPSSRNAVDLELQGAEVSLRAPSMSDYEAWAELRAASRAELTPYEPVWTRDELSRTAFRHRLKHYTREAAQDLGYALFIFDAAGACLLGSVTLSNVRRGVAQAATIGYWIGTPVTGAGHMTRALCLLAPFAYRTLKLHRLEAGCVPSNHASVRVLEKSGFRQEGLARNYLRINGNWQDHLLFARLADDPHPEVRS
jgi:[ribosomal protein S5]-alanine N-acetyltransferase